jgi:hypothetical protein
MKHRFRSLLLASLLAPAVLFAAAEKPAAVTMRCRAFAVGKKPASDLYVKTGNRYEKLSLSTDYIGKSFRTESKDGLVFYRKVPATKEKPESYVTCATCAPDGAGRQLIFFMPGEGEAMNLVAKSDAEGKFPPGTRLVLNISKHPVALDFGGTKLVVNPLQSGLLRAPVKSEQGVANVQIARQDKQGRWILFSSSSWLSDSVERKIVILYPSGPDNVSLSAIQDAVEEPDDEEKKATTGKTK